MMSLSLWSSFFIKFNLPFFAAILCGVIIVAERFIFSRAQPRSVLMIDVSKTAVIILMISYTLMIVEVTKPFQCVQDLDGSYSMASNPDVTCYSTTWNSHILGVILYLIIYALIIPLIPLVVMWRYRNNVLDQTFVSIFGVMTQSYSEQYYWWELIRLLKKSLFAITLNVLTPYLSRFVRYFCIITLVFVFFAVEVMIQPFKHSEINQSNLLYKHSALYLV
jgi:hypothetical protein